MTVVGGNKYKQCNFENIKKIPAAIILNRLSGVSLFCSFVYSSVWYNSGFQPRNAFRMGLQQLSGDA